MVCSAAAASSKAGLAASSFSSATTLSAYSVNITQEATGLQQCLCRPNTDVTYRSFIQTPI